MGKLNCVVSKNVGLIVSTSLPINYNDINGLDLDGLVRSTFSSLDIETIKEVGSEELKQFGDKYIDTKLVEEVIDGINDIVLVSSIDPKYSSLGSYSKEDIRSSIAMYMASFNESKENVRGGIGTNTSNTDDYGTLNSSYEIFIGESQNDSDYDQRLINDKRVSKESSNVTEEDIMIAYFDSDPGLYIEFINNIKSIVTNKLLDQSSINSKGLEFSEESIKNILNEILSLNYKASDSKANYEMHIFKTYFITLANKHFKFLNISGDIDYSKENFLEDITVNNETANKIVAHGQENKSGLGQNTEIIEYLISTTPRLIKVSDLPKDEKKRIFGDLRKITQETNDRLIQDPVNPFLTTADYVQLSSLFEDDNINTLKNIENKVKDSGSVGYSLFARFFNSNTNTPVQYLDTSLINKNVFGFNAIGSYTELSGDINESLFKGKNNPNSDAAVVVASRLFSMSRTKVVKSSSGGYTFIKEVSKTDNEIRENISSGLNSIYDNAGRIKVNIDSELRYEENESQDELTLEFNGIKATIKLSDIDRVKNNDKIGLFVPRDSVTNIDITDLEMLDNISKLLIELGFPIEIANSTFINQMEETKPDSIGKMISTALYSVYLNKKAEDVVDFGYPLENLKNNKFIIPHDKLMIKRDNITVYDYSSMMSDYISPIIDYLYNYGGFNEKRMIRMASGNSMSAVSLRESLNIPNILKKGTAFTSGNIYEKEGYKYINSAKITGFNFNGEYHQFNQASEAGKINYIVNDLFVGTLASKPNQMMLFGYATERKNREIHLVESKTALKLIDGKNKIDKDYFFNEIRDNRKTIINNTARLIQKKYKDVFNIDNSNTVKVLNSYNINEDVLIGITEQVDSIKDDINMMSELSNVLESLSIRFDVNPKIVMDIISKLELSSGIHYNPKGANLRDSMIMYHKIYNNNQTAQSYIDREFKYLRSANLSKYQPTEDSINHILNITNISSNDKDVTDLIKDSYTLNSMLHSDALVHLASGSVFQYKSDISESDKTKIQERVDNSVKIYNERNEGKIGFIPRGEQYINAEVEAQVYYQSLNNSMTDMAKRLGLLSSGGMYPILQENGSNGGLIDMKIPVAHTKDTKESNPLLGNQTDMDLEVADAQTYMNPIFFYKVKASFGGINDGYTAGAVPMKSSLYSVNPEEGGFLTQKETQANIYNSEGMLVMDTTMLRKWNTTIDFSEDGSKVPVRLPRVKVTMENDGDENTLSYRLDTDIEGNVIFENEIKFKNVQDIYDYYGGFQSDIADIHFLVYKVLSINEGLSDKFIHFSTSPSAVKSMSSVLNDDDVYRDNDKNLLVRIQDMENFKILLTKFKDNEKEITLATQFAGVMSSSTTIHEGSAIIDSMTAIGDVGRKVTSDNLRQIMADTINDKNVNDDIKFIVSKIFDDSINNNISSFDAIANHVNNTPEGDLDSQEAISYIYNRYLTKVVGDNIDKSRNSDEVVSLVEGLTSNFNISQIRAISEGMLRTEFVKLSLGIKTKGTETVMISGRNLLYLHKNDRGNWVLKHDIMNHDTKINSIAELYSVDDEITVISEGSTYIGSYIQLSKELPFDIFNADVYKRSDSIFLSINEFSGRQLKNMSDYTVVNIGGINIFKKDVNNIDNNSEYQVISKNKITNDTLISRDIVKYSMIPNSQNYINVDIDDVSLDNDGDFSVFEDGTIIRKKDVEYGVIIDSKLLGYIDLINERNINYYEFETDEGNDIRNTEELKTLHYFENGGQENGEGAEDDILMEENFQRIHNDIPNLAFGTIGINFKYNSKEETEQAYKAYKNSSIKDKYELEKEFIEIMETYDTGDDTINPEDRIAELTEGFRDFFRTMVNKRIKLDQYNIIQPEIVVPSMHYRTFGIEEGTTVEEIIHNYEESDNEQLNVLESIKIYFTENFDRNRDIPIRLNKYLTITSLNNFYRKKEKLGKEILSDNSNDLKLILNKYNEIDSLIDLLKSSNNEIDIDALNNHLEDVVKSISNDIIKNRIANFDKTLDVIMTRIPLQAKQSSSYSRIKEFVWGTSNSVYVSFGQYIVMGADNDADTTNMMVYVFGDKGELVSYKDYVERDENGKQFIPGYENNKLTSILNTATKPEDVKMVIDQILTDSKKSSIKLNDRLSQIESRIITNMDGQPSNIIMKAVNTAKKIEYDKFNDGMRNFIVDQLKKIYSDSKNIFEVQSPMTSNILESIVSKTIVRDSSVNSEKEDSEISTIKGAVNPLYMMQQIDDGSNSLGIVINSALASGYLSRLMGSKMLKNDLEISLYDEDTGEIDNISVSGTMDSDITNRDVFEHKDISISYSEDDIIVIENIENLTEEACK